jgi:hypothetical protein
MCAADELVVSVTCIAKLGMTNEAAHDKGDTGASCPTQNQPAQAVLLCASDSVRGAVLPQRQSTVVRPRRAAPVLICKKCIARSGEWKQLKRSLKLELKRQSDALSRKRPRVVKTSCFGICPKHAVVLTSGATLQRGEYVLVSESESISEAVAILMPV